MLDSPSDRRDLPPSRVLITGASGFVGARTAELLYERGHSLAVLVRDPRKAWRLKNLLPYVRIITGDIMAKDSYRADVMAFEPNVLVHAGWLGVTSAERNSPSQALNVIATNEVLETCLRAGMQHFIGLGSQAEYGPCNKKLNEDATLKPMSHYGESKAKTFSTTQARCLEADVRFAWIRLFSAYGPRDNPDWLVPSLIRKLRAREHMPLTPCEQLWDFIAIDDAASAVAHVTETTSANGAFNLGSGTAPPLRETIQTLRDLVAPGADLGFGEIAYRPDQVMHLEADITRLTTRTGWSPHVPLSKGLEQTVEWFRAHARS